MVLAVSKAMYNAQARYKRESDPRVPCYILQIRKHYYVLLKKECCNTEKKKRYKVSSIADGPYHVASTDK